MNFKSCRVVIAWALIPFFLIGCGYNKLQQMEEQVNKAWSDVESTLQRRSDLIPNLVEVVKGYAKHERETLEGVVAARSKATQTQVSAGDLADPDKLQKFADAQGSLTSALSKLLVVVEQYPDLKANQNFLDLQTQLEGTENRINVARQRYNEAVASFNAAVRKFPESLTNKFLLHLERKAYFQAQAGAQEAPKVKF
jgi:LemA protein